MNYPYGCFDPATRKWPSRFDPGLPITYSSMSSMVVEGSSMSVSATPHMP